MRSLCLGGLLLFPACAPPDRPRALPPASAALDLGGTRIGLVHYARDPERSMFPPVPVTPSGTAILCSWDRDRYLHFFGASVEGFDVHFLDAEGRILDVQTLGAHDERGVQSLQEARRALFLEEGSAERFGLFPGKQIPLPASIRDAAVEPMPEVTVGRDRLRVEIAYRATQRARGLMFRRRMSEGEGMLFLYRAYEPRFFYMKNTFLPLDIAYFDEDFRLIRAWSMEVYPNPEDTLPNAPSERPVACVLEVPFGWFAARRLVDAAGRPVAEVELRLSPRAEEMRRQAE